MRARPTDLAQASRRPVIRGIDSRCRRRPHGGWGGRVGMSLLARAFTWKEDDMSDQGVSFGIILTDVTMDDEGRLVIDDPNVAELVSAAMEVSGLKRPFGQPKPKPAQPVAPVVNNCHGG